MSKRLNIHLPSFIIHRSTTLWRSIMCVFTRRIAYSLHLLTILILLHGLLSPVYLASASFSYIFPLSSGSDAHSVYKFQSVNDDVNTSLSASPISNTEIKQQNNLFLPLMMPLSSQTQLIEATHQPNMLPVSVLISTEISKLIPDESAAFDEFGYSVAADGNYAIIGAPGGDDQGTNSGSAYIFKYSGNNWGENCSGAPLTCEETQKLIASDGTADDRFGESVAIYGNYAIVGSPLVSIGGGSDDGAAYIFKRDGENWVQQVKLITSDVQHGYDLGSTVAIGEDYALVATDRRFHSGESDEVYVFKRDGNNWGENCSGTPLTCEETQKLTVSGLDQNFGSGITINDDDAIVGGTDAAYIFEYDGNNWGENCSGTPLACEATQRLIASDGVSGDHFGESVATDGDYIIVGAYNGEINGSNSGSAYTFKRNGNNWGENCSGTLLTCEETQKLIASDGAAGDHFGESVAINSNTVIVGALFADNGSSIGAAYAFNYNGNNWGENCSGTPLTCEETQKLIASDSTSNDRFGESIATNLIMSD